MKYPILFFFGIAILFSSCGPNYRFEKVYEMEAEQWPYADTLDFTFNIEDTSAIYNLYLEVGHSTSYGFQNLYTQVYTRFPSGERIKELLSLELAGKGGTWLGDCGKDYCTLRIPIQEGAFFNQAGNYTITLQQYMRVDPVAGVRSIAFKLEDTGQRRGGDKS
ncbi:MAG TPA: gliding motility lipoprotein GldH [Saprospiraceae bacterium]|nr:gliding motility lipoprotein GldH [Lewinellaceae bacterium]HQU60535.1 gliding motility lipoprotein GldH [Saprospiraceae bacterium]